MNHLGWTLAWLTGQVTLLLLPALGLHALAARRGRVVGGGLAAWSLGLVVLLDGAALLPEREASQRTGRPPVAESPARPDPDARPNPANAAGASAQPVELAAGRLSLARWRGFWSQFGRQASGPAERVHPWGWLIAVGCLGAIGWSSIRLGLGLGAIHLCRRRGEQVADPSLLGLIEELRAAMGCRRAVTVRVVADLTTPATAGWLRPLVLLPPSWPTWTEAERRAVLAHEIAHVVRGDYAAGLLARAIVVANAANPLVRWLAGRLVLEQELAADALGARFAGGPSLYLEALAGLLLRQDGKRSPTGPARAFLPDRGTLIRRIAMLRHEQETGLRRTWPRSLRCGVALGLLGLTLSLGTMRQPAWAGDDPAAPSMPNRPAPVSAPVPGRGEPTAPADPLLTTVAESAVVVAVHPAELVRHPGMDRVIALVRKELSFVEEIAHRFPVDRSRAGLLTVQLSDIDTIVMGLKFETKTTVAPNPESTVAFSTEGLTIRTVAPFNWLGFVRQWSFPVEEMHDARQVYYKVMLTKAVLGPGIGSDMPMGIMIPDERTVVFQSEDWVRHLANRATPKAPAFLQGADWVAANRGLLAVAVNNANEALTNQVKLIVGDDAETTLLRDSLQTALRGVDHWVFGLGAGPNEAITVQGEATMHAAPTAPPLAAKLTGWVQLGQQALAAEVPATSPDAQSTQWLRRLLAQVQIKTDALRVLVEARGFATYADLATLLAPGGAFDPAVQPTQLELPIVPQIDPASGPRKLQVPPADGPAPLAPAPR